jgi:EAL domain-containing protein (putative c-di-GMP-specific phosphodiesterase class I)
MPGERHLVAAIERALRGPSGWSAVALHLSRLAAPGPRPHHWRIARAVMQDAAQRVDGQIFAMRNGDIVLLGRDRLTASGDVPATLRRLFGGAAGDTATVVSEWRLPHAGAALLAYTAERIGELETANEEEGDAPPAWALDNLAAAVATTAPGELIRRQAAVLLEPASGSAGVTMRVLYRELTCSLESLEARIEPSMRISNDHALRRQLGPELDRRMLRFLREGRGSGTPLDAALSFGAALHLNMSLPGAVSEAFAAFAEASRAAGPALGVEIALVEAVADPAAFSLASARIRRLGARVILDGVSHLALLLARPWALRPDHVKLDWSPGIAELRAEDRSELARAIAEADPARLILHRADSEAAIRWGLALGVRRFQGYHIDQILGAQRMLACRGAPACTLRQCSDRAGAIGGAGRTGCTNLPLLDAGLPAALAAETAR